MHSWTDDEFSAEFSGDSDTECATTSRDVIEDPEVWMDYYSEDLLDLWYSLKERCESRGFAILDTCQFSNFAQFCFQNSSGYPPPA